MPIVMLPTTPATGCTHVPTRPHPHPQGLARTLLLAVLLTGASAHVWAEPASPRLKFRSQGAVCVCATDLDEQKISRAIAARAATSASASTAVAAPARPASTPARSASNPPSVTPQEQRQ